MIELTVARLREGTALHSLVHAVVISKWPDFENEVSWDEGAQAAQDDFGQGPAPRSAHPGMNRQLAVSRKLLVPRPPPDILSSVGAA